MDKRYQVFVSSTFTDLEGERHGIMQTLMKLDCIPAGMELFPAADEEQWAFIQKVIDDCDYYLLVIGGRYGSTTSDGISYTEKEHDYAVSKGIHVIGLLHGDPDQLPVAKSEMDEPARKKLEAFRQKVSDGRLVKFWKSEPELLQNVVLSLTHAIKAHPRPGWVRGGSASNPELLMQINELRQSNDELRKQLAEVKPPKPFSNEICLADAGTEFTLEITFYIRISGYPAARHIKHSCSWNAIIGFIGPRLIENSLSDDLVNAELAMSICSRLGNRANSATISSEDFKTVKIQLLALGYIEMRDGEMSKEWAITPLGNEVMFMMRTVKA